MNDSLERETWGGTLLTIVLTMIGVVALMSFYSNAWKQDAIKHGVAEYNRNTGKWQWKTNLIEIPMAAVFVDTLTNTTDYITNVHSSPHIP